MPDYEIRDTTAEDVEYLAEYMREIDKDEIRAVHGDDVDILSVLENAEMLSVYSKTCLVGSVPVAIFGVTPFPQSDDIGVIWLLCTDELFDVVGKLSFHKESVRRLREIHEIYPKVFNVCLASNEASIQWLDALGFNFPTVLPHYGLNNRVFLMFERGA
jgi:hypothetical protein